MKPIAGQVKSYLSNHINTGVCFLITLNLVSTARHNVQKKQTQTENVNYSQRKDLVTADQIKCSFYINNALFHSLKIDKIIQLFPNELNKNKELQQQEVIRQDIVILRLKQPLFQAVPAGISKFVFNTDKKLTFIKINYENPKTYFIQQIECAYKAPKSNQNKYILLDLEGVSQSFKTISGDSGSPILQFLQGQWRYVGLHIGQQHNLQSLQNLDKIQLIFTEQHIKKIKQEIQKQSQNVQKHRKQLQKRKIESFNKYLYLENRKLSYQKIGLSDIQFLQNKINQIPASLYEKLINIKYLNLNENKLTYMILTQTCLPHLQTLILSRNYIKFSGGQKEQNNYLNIMKIPDVNISDNLQHQKLDQTSFQLGKPFRIKKFQLEGQSFMKFFFDFNFLNTICYKDENENGTTSQKLQQEENNYVTTRLKKTSSQQNQTMDSQTHWKKIEQDNISSGQSIDNIKRILFRINAGNGNLQNLLIKPLKQMQIKLAKQQNFQIVQKLKQWKIQVKISALHLQQGPIRDKIEQFNKKSTIFKFSNIEKKNNSFYIQFKKLKEELSENY